MVPEIIPEDFLDEHADSQVIAMPGASCAPVQNARHRGRYPKGVVSLQGWQRAKQNKARQAAWDREAKKEKNKRCIVRVLHGLIRKAEAEGIEGLVYMLGNEESKCPGGGAAGLYHDDPNLALNALNSGADSVIEVLREEKRGEAH